MLLKVKKSNVAELLVGQFNFKHIASDVDDYFYLEPPELMSNTKAKKLLSLSIKLVLAQTDLFKAKDKYNKLVEEINKIELE